MSSSALDPTHTGSASPGVGVSRSDIRASAEKILYTYLLRGSEREIVLPEVILHSIANAIEVDGRDDPEVFDEAKDYVFQAMERDAFPGFLTAKALGNLVPASAMIRLIVGLLAMFAGFWAGFALIFLDIKPKATRLWVSLDFARFSPLAFPYILSHGFMWRQALIGDYSSSFHSLLEFTVSWRINTL